MRYLSTVLLFILSTASFGQDCSNPVSGVLFQQRFNLIAQQNEDQLKLIVAKDFVNKYCLTSSQVKTIALLFKEDANRLTFCMEASGHVLDKVNFYDVYDAFNSFSNAFRLHDYVNNEHKPVEEKPHVPVPNKPKVITFPAIAYPSYVNYKGQKGCDGPVMSGSKFNSIAQNVNIQPTDESKMLAIYNSFDDNNCFSFALAMKLVSLVENEALRLKALEKVFLNVYDLENYSAGTGLFSTYKYQQTWTAFAAQALKPAEPEKPAAPSCAVSNEDFGSIMNSLRREHFSRDKMAIMNGLVKDRCFNIDQIRIMMKEFISGKDALEVAKMCWWRCTEQKNYHEIVDALTFSMDKAELRNFIANNSN